jgi:hypothetical protein
MLKKTEKESKQDELQKIKWKKEPRLKETFKKRARRIGRNKINKKSYMYEHFVSCRIVLLFQYFLKENGCSAGAPERP